MKIRLYNASVEEGAYERALDFLLPMEASCLTLSQFVIKKDPHIFIVQAGEEVKGVFYFKQAASLFFAFSGGFKMFSGCLVKFFSGKKVFCLSGRRDWNDFLLSILKKVSNKSPREERNCLLMEGPSPLCSKKERDPKFLGKIKKCSLEDVDALMGLQAAYIREEVLPKGRDLYLPGLRKSFENALKEDVVFALQGDDSFVAKAQTNAIGKNYAQLGGVYTLPALRGQGLGKALVESLIDYFARENKSCVLFVKKDNISALNLYKKLNFKIIAPYKICYF